MPLFLYICSVLIHFDYLKCSKAEPIWSKRKREERCVFKSQLLSVSFVKRLCFCLGKSVGLFPSLFGKVMLRKLNQQKGRKQIIRSLELIMCSAEGWSIRSEGQRDEEVEGRSLVEDEGLDVSSRGVPKVI